MKHHHSGDLTLSPLPCIKHFGKKLGHELNVGSVTLSEPMPREFCGIKPIPYIKEFFSNALCNQVQN
jgi:hypothetical protein